MVLRQNGCFAPAQFQPTQTPFRPVLCVREQNTTLFFVVFYTMKNRHANIKLSKPHPSSPTITLMTLLFLRGNFAFVVSTKLVGELESATIPIPPRAHSLRSTPRRPIIVSLDETLICVIIVAKAGRTSLNPPKSQIPFFELCVLASCRVRPNN